MPMSNKYRRTEAPAPQTPQFQREDDLQLLRDNPQSSKPRPSVRAPRNLAELESQIAIRKMIDNAVETLYKRRGGERIDALLRLFDDGVALANLCRENEIKRAKGGSTQREKGERPLISCSESRLYGNKALVLWRERETLMADARSRISVVLEAWQPRDAKEMQAALDVALGELTQTAREVIAARERELAKAESEADEIGREGAALIREVKDEIDRELLTEAWTEGDEKQMQEVLSRQPLEWLKKWASLTERAQKYA